MLARIFLLALLLTGLAACADETAATAVLVAREPEDRIVRFYGVRHAVYPDDMDEGDPRPLPPSPAFQDVAVKVADGYLLSSLRGMGGIADSMLADPRVELVRDGVRYPGAYVDYDSATHLALIRADVPGDRLDLRASKGPPDDIAIVAGSRPYASLQVTRDRGCTRVEETELWDCPEFYGTFRLMVVLGVDGRTVALVTMNGGDALGDPIGRGVSSARAVRYLDQYFAGWGAHVPKPEY